MRKNLGITNYPVDKATTVTIQYTTLVPESAQVVKVMINHSWVLIWDITL